MPGEAAVAMWWDVAPEARAEWEQWHTVEHMPERLGISGFLRGSRWSADGSYFVLYEAQDLATLAAGAYLERLNNPTPWSRRMGELPELPKGRGITGAALLQSRPMSGAPTAEQKIRGGDASADWVLLIGGYDANAVHSAAVVPGGTVGVYHLAYSLARG
ncbi:MAG: hypothetical protein ACT4P4_18535 [Betaproteobacteria bacterium]